MKAVIKHSSKNQAKGLLNGTYQVLPLRNPTVAVFLLSVILQMNKSFKMQSTFSADEVKLC